MGVWAGTLQLGAGSAPRAGAAVGTGLGPAATPWLLLGQPAAALLGRTDALGAGVSLIDHQLQRSPSARTANGACGRRFAGWSPAAVAARRGGARPGYSPAI